jgi:hypothetical protein
MTQLGHFYNIFCVSFWEQIGSINPDNVITFDEMFRHLIKKMYLCRFINKKSLFQIILIITAQNHNNNHNQENKKGSMQNQN